MNKDARERFTLRLPTSLFQHLTHKANAVGVSVNALILQILWDWDKKNPPADQTDAS